MYTFIKGKHIASIHLHCTFTALNRHLFEERLRATIKNKQTKQKKQKQQIQQQKYILLLV